METKTFWHKNWPVGFGESVIIPASIDDILTWLQNDSYIIHKKTWLFGDAIQVLDDIRGPVQFNERFLMAFRLSYITENRSYLDVTHDPEILELTSQILSRLRDAFGGNWDNPLGNPLSINITLPTTYHDFVEWLGKYPGIALVPETNTDAVKIKFKPLDQARLTIMSYPQGIRLCGWYLFYGSGDWLQDFEQRCKKYFGELGQIDAAKLEHPAPATQITNKITNITVNGNVDGNMIVGDDNNIEH
jgi:hypothetical protein